MPLPPIVIRADVRFGNEPWQEAGTVTVELYAADIVAPLNTCEIANLTGSILRVPCEVRLTRIH